MSPRESVLAAFAIVFALILGAAVNWAMFAIGFVGVMVCIVLLLFWPKPQPVNVAPEDVQVGGMPPAEGMKEFLEKDFFLLTKADVKLLTHDLSDYDGSAEKAMEGMLALDTRMREWLGATA